MFDRFLEPFRQLVLQILSERLYGLYPYVVSSFDDQNQLVAASPLRKESGLSDVAGVSIRTPLLKVKLTVGTQVLIGFEGGDPAYPYVANCDLSSTLASALAIARQGDMVGVPIMLVPAVGPTGPIPNVFSITFVGAPPPPPFTLATGGPVTLYGTVTSGSLRNRTP